MRIAVISCWKYRDAWKPFFALFNKFWPDCPYPVDLVIDNIEDESWIPKGANVVGVGWPAPWGKILAHYSATMPLTRDQQFEDALLLMQEDFLLNAPVQGDLIAFALEQMKKLDAGCFRLYPCPGADDDLGHPLYGLISRDAQYRISCQAALWRPEYVNDIAYNCYRSAADFEIGGTQMSRDKRDPLLAWKRGARPFPISYIATAIVRGCWLPEAVALCIEHGIDADFSMRPVRAA